jgi:ADP-dependent NAD(P)H-hydrate dehydratase / NAD(P)H-hydrate epimerase
MLGNMQTRPAMSSTWADPVLSCAGARTLETHLFGGDEEKEWTAMQRAGTAVARALLEDFKEIGGFPANGRVLVLVGKGHNGGDALLAADEILSTRPEAAAHVSFIFGERALRPLAVRAWRRLLETAGKHNRVRPVAINVSEGTALVAAGSGERSSYDLCLDGIFGFQFHPPVDAATAEVLRAVNSHPGIRLRAAVDLPSGVGEQAGDTFFRADFTYATGSVKAPILEEGNRAATGRLRYCDLGFFDRPVAGIADPGFANSALHSASPAVQLSAAVTNFVLNPSVLAPLAGLRAALSDKRTFGHLFVIGGSRSYPGAALMCVRAALRSGVGLVTAFVPESLVPAFAATAPEAIWAGWPETPEGSLALEGLHLLRARLQRATALVVGSGLGPEAETHALVAEIVKLAEVPLVLDADALQPSNLAAARGKRVICLPHAGEFKRLAGGREATPAVLRATAREANATIVLKGPVTQISDGDRIYHSLVGGPVLARGGSGDLLAGLTGGVLAQTPDDTLLAACRGVVWHGMAADLLARDRGQVAVQVTQLLDHLPAALRDSARPFFGKGISRV